MDNCLQLAWQYLVVTLCAIITISNINPGIDRDTTLTRFITSRKLVAEFVGYLYNIEPLCTKSSS